MEDKEKVLQQLLERIAQLSRQQRIFQEEIQKLQNDILTFRSASSHQVGNESIPSFKESSEPRIEPVRISKDQTPPVSQRVPMPRARHGKTPWEEFIGANLLNKVGIAVLVIGIGFGAKYSIDHDLINPLTRIILGYLSGISLLVIAFRLRKDHEAFSAVLLSGGMAVLYFITFAAYDFYGLIPQMMAFMLMVVLTIFTVFAAIQYNMEVIGIIGLVGAYAVPILLSDGSGRVVILFSYMCLINTGILFLAFQKYWKRLYYLAFILTWLTFASWYAFSFDRDLHVSVSIIFSTIFFLIFYATFLSYKLVRRESLSRWDVLFMLLNSFIYFGYGYLTIEALPDGDQFLGLFTIFTAFIHFIAATIIYRQQERFNDVFYFVAGMVLIFLTIAVPVQLEGNWVTLVWAGEAALLFWIGRSKSFPTYEKLSYSLILLAFVSLLHDWSNAYPSYYYYDDSQDADFIIFLNVQFLTSMLVAGSLMFIFWLNKNKPVPPDFEVRPWLHKWLTIGLPVLTLVVVYFGFYKEIEAFWNHGYADSRIAIRDTDSFSYDQYNENLLNFKGLWLIIYSAFFGLAMSLFQIRYNNRLLAFGCLAINSLVLFAFITAGLLDLNALRERYLSQDLAAYYSRDQTHLLIRYFAILSMVPLLILNMRLVKLEYFTDKLRKGEHLFFHFIILVVLSSELIHWLDMARVEDSFKLSLSILWGAYALFLIVLGLSKDQKHLRLGAMILFAATLLKLFAYDMEDMSTILKTIVMVILGALLLIASFIYNKFKRSTGHETP